MGTFDHFMPFINQAERISQADRLVKMGDPLSLVLAGSLYESVRQRVRDLRAEQNVEATADADALEDMLPPGYRLIPLVKP